MSLTYRDFLSTDEHRPGVLCFGGVRMALVDIEAGFWGVRRQMEALVGQRLTDAVLQQAGINGGASFARALVGQAPATEGALRQAQDGAQALRDCVVAYEAAGFGRFEIETLEWPFGYAQGKPTGRAVIRAWDTFEAWAALQHGQTSARPVCAYSAGVLVGFVNVLAGRQDVVCIKHTCQAQGAESCLFELLLAEAAGDVPVIGLAPDPALGRQLNLLEILFERMPMGIAIFDRELQLRRFNPTWAEFIDRYTPSSARQVVPGVRFFDLAPDIEATVTPLLERVLAGETVRQEALCLESGGIVSCWDVVFTPLIEDHDVVGVVYVTTDATERVLAYQTLEQRVEERTHELSTLLEVSHNVASTLDLGPLLGLILDQLKLVVDYNGSTIFTLDGDDLVIQAYRGPMSQEETLRMRFSLDNALDREVILERKPVIVSDIRGDTALAQAFQESVGQSLETTFGHIRSWMGVPLIVKDQAIGMLAVDHSEPNHYSARQAELALAFANQAAVAIENARLFAQVERSAVAAERSRLARELHDAVTQTLFSASLIAEVLPRLWERDRDEGRKRLEELRELTRGALAEMRTLLLELRPSALADAKLGDLLRQLAESITGRARVPVTVEIEGERDLPPEVKVALYRIAQEALNNVAKHAGASQASVSLHCQPERVELCIRDDGRGFNLESVSPESLGLDIMRERAEAIGAALELESEIKRGTEVKAIWKEPSGGKQR